jgi:hypothetical protein
MQLPPPPKDVESLKSKILAAWRECGYVELENLQIGTHADKLVLSGRVSTFFLRQKAECIALTLAGAGTLESKIAVDGF